MKAINTGIGVAWTRAAGMLYPKEQRLFEDPYSEKLLTPLYKFFIILMRSPKKRDSIIKSKEKVIPGMIGWFFCRFRYIDDILKNSIEKKEIKAVINLGSGMDCRAYYTPGIKDVHYFEVDYPVIIKKKKAKIKKIFGRLPDHVVYVPVDFEKQNLDTELDKAGYNLNLRTFFILEGVTQYISEKANDITLKYMAQAAPGSKIVFTYIIKSFIEGKDIHDGIVNMYKAMCKKNKPLWIFGLDPHDINNFLSRYSLSLIEDVGSKDLQERYNKLVELDLIKTVNKFDIERFVLAEVKK